MKVKLVSGLSFRRQGHFFERHGVREVSDDHGAELLGSGRFIEVAEEATSLAPPEPEAEEEDRTGEVQIDVTRIEATKNATSTITIPMGGLDLFLNV